MIRKGKLPQYFSISIILFLGLIIAFGLGQSLISLLISASIAYLVFPMVIYLETIGIKRHWAVLFVFGLAILALIVLFLWLLPIILNDMANFILSLPKNIQIAMLTLQAWADHYGFQVNLQADKIRALIEQSAKHISIDTLWSVTSIVKNLFAGVLNTLLTLLNFFLIPVFFFYIIQDYELLRKQIQSWIPKAWRATLTSKTKQFNEIFQGYFRGQLIVASIQAIYYATMLSALGIQFGFFIGLATGFLTIIPYVGYTVGILATTLVLLSSPFHWPQIIGVIVTFGFAQIIESFYLTPRLVGNKVGLSELTTMLALIIGGQIFGLIGMFLAIPTASLIKLTLKDLKKLAKIWG